MEIMNVKKKKKENEKVKEKEKLTQLVKVILEPVVYPIHVRIMLNLSTIEHNEC